MNCPDITRIANTGSFARLTEAERSAAEAHALTCRDCAPVWAAHARLAELRVPRIPSELSLRCRTAAAAGPQQVRYPLRRLTLIGGLVALAAAAGALMWYWGRSLPSASAAFVAADAAVTTTVAEPALKPAAPGPAPEIILPAAEPEAEQVAPAAVKLPLVPAPAGRPPDREKSLLALQKAVERHPEMVQGPELDDASIFFVSVAMRTDGAVLNSAAELASPATSPEISNRLLRMLPLDAGEDITSFFVKGQQLSEGRVLRAQVILRGVLISDSFDVARSDVRVREILGHKYDDLLTPPSSDEFSVLTILLSDDGRILREKVERATMQNAAVVLGLGTGARQEETIAAKLGIGVEQIGLIGTTTLEQGTPTAVIDQTGVRRVEGVRHLPVRYAWARRTEEPAVIHTPRRADEPQADFDLAAALVVVERLLPDSFSHAPPSLADMAARPTVVFTDKGEVIRAGRVQMRNGVDLDSLLQEQLVPGVSTGLHRSVRLTNKAGATAMVTFAWERD